MKKKKMKPRKPRRKARRRQVDSYMIALGQVFKERRERAGLTLEELAARSELSWTQKKITPADIDLWEQGRGGMTFVDLLLISQGLNLDNPSILFVEAEAKENAVRP